VPVAARRVDPSYRLYFCPHPRPVRIVNRLNMTVLSFALPPPEFCPNLPLNICPADLMIGGAPLFLDSLLPLDYPLQLHSIGQLCWREFVSVLNRLTTHPGEELFVLIYHMIPIVITLNSQLRSVAVSVN